MPALGTIFSLQQLFIGTTFGTWNNLKIGNVPMYGFVNGNKSIVGRAFFA